MNTTYFAGVIALAVVIAGGSFWGGMAYARTHTPATFRGNTVNNGQFGTAAGGRTFRTSAGGFTGGEILSKDATSLTVKTADGSTKIVLIGSNTEVSKMAAGSLDDLTTGANVTISGSANADGSITAQTISLRPASAPRTAAQ